MYYLVDPKSGIIHRQKRKKVEIMNLVSKEYLTLFNAMTDIDKALNELHGKIVFAQQLDEEIFMSHGDTEDDMQEPSESA